LGFGPGKVLFEEANNIWRRFDHGFRQNCRLGELEEKIARVPLLRKAPEIRNVTGRG
jgi:hypothetical protein